MIETERFTENFSSRLLYSAVTYTYYICPTDWSRLREGIALGPVCLSIFLSVCIIHIVSQKGLKLESLIFLEACDMRCDFCIFITVMKLQ